MTASAFTPFDDDRGYGGGYGVLPASLGDLDHRVRSVEATLTTLATLQWYGLRRTFHGYQRLSPHHPLRAMDQVDAGEAEAMVATLAGTPVDAYVHFPYREYLSAFCHAYEKPAGRDGMPAREDAALTRIEAEIALHHRILGQRLDLRSLHIGGGTPSLISNRRLRTLLENIAGHVAPQPDAEVRFDLYPQDHDERELRDKLRILRDHGVTDLTIDLVSGNKRTLDYLNRPRSSLEAYLRLIDVCVDEGLTSISTGLMAGLPHETYESLDRTLQTIMTVPEVRTLTVHPVVMRESDPISAQFRRDPRYFHDARTRDQMWLFARSTLRSRGYAEGPVSSFRASGRPPARPAGSSLGFGPSAFSHLGGPGSAVQYVNFCNERDHAASVDAGHLPVWRIGRLDGAARARRAVILGLATGDTVDLSTIEASCGVSLDDVHGSALNALLALNLIERDGPGIRYTEIGRCRLEEISYYLRCPTTRDRCDQPPTHTDPHRRELVNQHHTVTVPPEDRTRFEAFIAQQSPRFTPLS